MLHDFYRSKNNLLMTCAYDPTTDRSDSGVGEETLFCKGGEFNLTHAACICLNQSLPVFIQLATGAAPVKILKFLLFKKC